MLYVKLKYPATKADEVAKFLAESIGAKFQTLVSYSNPGDGLFTKTEIVHIIAADDDQADKIKANMNAYVQK